MSQKLGLVQKFKAIVKKYWYIALPVHVATSGLYFGSFYGATKAGLNFVPMLEKTPIPEKYINSLKKDNIGNIAQALIMFKLIGPLRYGTTLLVTRSAIKQMRKRDWIK